MPFVDNAVEEATWSPTGIYSLIAHAQNRTHLYGLASDGDEDELYRLYEK